MKRAADARCYGGRWLWHSRAVGQIIATFFLRSYERSERVYRAMVSRGFEGKGASPGAARLHAGDIITTAASIGWFFLLRASAL